MTSDVLLAAEGRQPNPLLPYLPELVMLSLIHI